MQPPALHLLDPGSKLQSLSETLRRLHFVEHADRDSLLDAITDDSTPSVVVADFTETPVPEAVSLAGMANLESFTLLVALEDGAPGHEWLEAGADDFVLLPSRAEELEGRVKRLLKLWTHKFCLEPGNDLGAYFCNLAHEIKNPLNVIFGLCEILLEDSPVAAEARTDLEGILRNAQEILEISNRIALHGHDLRGLSGLFPAAPQPEERAAR